MQPRPVIDDTDVLSSESTMACPMRRHRLEDRRADGVRRVVRCDCWRERRWPTRLMAEARIPARYQPCDFDNFATTNETRCASA